MDPANKNLKVVIDEFLAESNRVLKTMKRTGEEPKKDDLERLSKCIWDLRHFACELLEHGPSDENAFYNARIIKQIMEEPITLDRETSSAISLIDAADRVKRENQEAELQKLVSRWNNEVAMRKVFFDDLHQIAQELAA